MGRNKKKRNLCPYLDKRGLWRLTGEIAQPEHPWPLNDIQQKALLDFYKAQERGAIKFVQRMHCACGAEQPIHFSNIDRFGIKINSYICGKCGLIYTSPVLSQDSIKCFYEDHYHLMTFGSHPASDKVLYKKGQGRKIYNLLKSWIEGNDINILEIGCGSGSVIKEFTQEAVADGLKVSALGLEYSQDYVDCFDPENLDISILTGNIQKINPKHGPFDIIIMSHVFEHFLEPHIEVESLKKIINYNSLIYIEVPGIFSLKYRDVYDCDYLKYFTFSHIYNFNLTSLTNLLNKNGFGLLWGNEEIQSIYMLGEQKIDTSENANNIGQYINNIEKEILYYQYLLENITNVKNSHSRINSDLKLINSDLKYVKSFVDKILSTFPFNILNKIRSYFKVK